MYILRKIIVTLCFATALSRPVGAAVAGDPAPEFELPTLEGKQVSLSEFRGDVVLLSFWASWCPPCKDEFPVLNRVAADYAVSGVKVIAISIDKARANVRKFLEAEGHDVDALSLILARDPDALTVARFNARAMPTSYVIDRRGNVRYAHSGYTPGDAAAWRREIDEILAEDGGSDK